MHAFKIIRGLVKKDFVGWVKKIRQNEYISASRDSWNFPRKIVHPHILAILQQYFNHEMVYGNFQLKKFTQKM